MEIKATSVFVSPADVGDKTLMLDPAESHHLVRVMRARTGDIFSAIDGCGKRITARISSIENGRVTAEILETRERVNEFDVELALYCGLCRPAKADLIVEKATELGVNSIGFCFSENSYLKDKRLFSEDSRLNRWRNIARSAAKQSLRSVVPRISPPVDLEAMLVYAEKYRKKIIADQHIGMPPESNFLKPTPDSIFLLVGPEAGFTETEISRITGSGFQALSLGRRRLRAETAAISLLSVIGFILESK